MNKHGILLWIGLFALISTPAAELTVKTVDKPPPKEVAEPIQSMLQPKAIQLLDGDKAILEFWFRQEVPTKSKPASTAAGLQEINEMTLLGVATVAEGRRDYKDGEIPAGTYTIRSGLQPQDGDHLGTADFPFFAVLIPAKADNGPDSFKTYKSMMKASGKVTATGHPIVLSLRPVAASTPAPTLTSPIAEHKAVTVTLKAKTPDSDPQSSISFDLVYEGRYKG